MEHAELEDQLIETRTRRKNVTQLVLSLNIQSDNVLS